MKNKIKQVRKLALFIAFTAIVVILLNACGKITALSQKEIPITEEIKGVIIEGPWDVIITQNSTNNSIVIEYNIPENKITAKLRSNGYLHIKVSSVGNYHRVILRAEINATALEKIEGSGATTIRTYGQFKHSTDISLSGASNLDGFLCEGEYANASLSGASTLKNFTFNGNELEARLSGASNFSGKGYAMNSSFTGSGASNFKTFNLESENLDLDLSGASHAEVTVNHTIKGSLTGASTLKYKKAENVKVSVEGASKIIQMN
jgi:hypothetical protein